MAETAAVQVCRFLKFNIASLSSRNVLLQG